MSEEPGLRDDLARGVSLPASWYTDPSMTAREQAGIFRRAWQYLGRAEQVARVGDFIAGAVAEVPVVAVRGESGLKAFVNVCRHRRHEVVSGAGNRRTLHREMIGRAVVLLVPVACLAYAAVGIATRAAWLSAAAAILVAWLLWRRHRRARFAAYVYFTAVALRAALLARWPTLAFAVAVVLVMQTPPALAAWPRLTPGLGPGGRIRRS